MTDSPILSVSHLKKSFGEHEVLRDISFDVQQGDVVSIIGASGSGKSTLLRCINFLEQPTAGTILFQGKNAETQWSRAQYHAKVGMVFQSFNLFPHMSVLDNVTIGPRKVRRIDRKEAEKKALELLGRVGLGDKADVYPSSLSGGQKQRVAIARALANEPPLILADEPTGNLDTASSVEIMDLFSKLHDEGATVVSSLLDGVKGQGGAAVGALGTVLDCWSGLLDAYAQGQDCLLYTSPSPRDRQKSRMPSSA